MAFLQWDIMGISHPTPQKISQLEHGPVAATINTLEITLDLETPFPENDLQLAKTTFFRKRLPSRYVKIAIENSH